MKESFQRNENFPIVMVKLVQQNWIEKFQRLVVNRIRRELEG